MTPAAKRILIAVAIAVAALLAVVLLWPRPATPPSASSREPSASPASSRAPSAPPAAPASPSTTPPDTDPPVAVFLGDSYTVGSATSLAGDGFPAILGERRGWLVLNLAIPGTGYATGRPDGRCPAAGCTAYVGVLPDALRHDPDIVVVSGGRNDLGRPHLEESVVAFYDELRMQLPEARIIVTSPLWDDSATPTGLIELRGIVEREAAAVGAEHLDLGDLFLDRPELIASDDLHPNEAGLELIAARIDELLPR